MPVGALSVAVAQPLSAGPDVAANAEHHAEIIDEAGARLVVFPELSLTGYYLDAPPVAPDDPRLGPIADVCATKHAVALVGAPVREGDHEFIAMIVVGDGKARVAYRKMLPGAEEARRFADGPEPGLLVIDDWRLGLAICRETGIEHHAAQTAALGIDAYVAGVVEAAATAHVNATRAQRAARDHNVWAVTASFAGPTSGGFDETAGCSGIWRPDGSTAAELGSEPGTWASAALT